MYLVRFTLDGGRSPRQPAAELLHDALWAHLRLDYGVEHITVTAMPAGFDLFLFLCQDIPDPDPVRYARNLLEAVARNLPALRCLDYSDTADMTRDGMADP